jgi:hypothetical protein
MSIAPSSLLRTPGGRRLPAASQDASLLLKAGHHAFLNEVALRKKTVNLSLGRRLQHYDMRLVWGIVRDAQARNSGIRGDFEDGDL